MNEKIGMIVIAAKNKSAFAHNIGGSKNDFQPDLGHPSL